MFFVNTPEHYFPDYIGKLLKPFKTFFATLLQFQSAKTLRREALIGGKPSQLL